MTLRAVVATVFNEPYEDLPPAEAHFQGRARREGYEYDAVAIDFLEKAGAVALEGRQKRHHYSVDGLIRTANDRNLLVLAHGNVGEAGKQPGLRRPDTVSKVVHRALMLHDRGEPPLVVVTSHLPLPGSATAHHLADARRKLGDWLVDVVATTGDFGGFLRLHWYFTRRPRPDAPQPAPWWDPLHRPVTLLDALPPGEWGSVVR